MKEIALTKGYVALVDDEDYAALMDGPSWHALVSKRHKIVYARRNKPGRGGGTELMHRVLLGVTDRNVHVDHRDGDGLHNWRSNLRPGSRTSNIRNQDPVRRSGVRWRASENRWIVQIQADGVNHYLGCFKDKGEALAARRAGELKYWGYIPERRR